MDLDPQVFFSKIAESLQSQSETESLRLLDSFNRSLIEEVIDSELLDLYMPHFFYTSDSLMQFVEKAIKIKVFKKSCQKALEILYTVLNNFYHKLYEKDITSLYRVTSQIIKSLADASIKAKIFDIVIRSLEKSDGCLEDSAISVYKDMYKALLFSLRQKNPDTVKNRELQLVGYLSKKYSFVIEDVTQLRNILWNNFELYCSITQRKISQHTIFGFYKGFGDFLENFPFNLDSPDEQRKVQKVYNNLKFLVVLNNQERLKFGNRAAITFFSNYTFLFKENLLKEYKYWHDKLLLWLDAGLEENKVGATALKSFYQTIAKVLEESDKKECSVIVQYFVRHCKMILDKKESSNYEKRLSVFCLKEFASASHKHMDPGEVAQTFLLIMQIFESIFIEEYNSENEEWEYLPDYIQTVANYMRFKEFTSSQFFCLQKGVINMIKSFHQLPYLHHGLVVESFLLTLFYLKRTQNFDTFLENVVYQGVVWSCSHQPLIAEAFLDEPSQNLVTVKNYYSLWRGILKLSTYRSYDKYEFFLEDRRIILERLISELVKTLMILVNKLNLSVLQNKDVTSTDLDKAYKIKKIDDYAIFLNVVDFYKDIFDQIEPRMFRKCITKMINHLISKCLKYPLISGFYKLLSFCLKISQNLSLFANVDNRQEITNCHETLTIFLTTLLNKMTDFKDDLLISSLQVLLETPVEIIEPLLPSCVVPFINIFEVGRSYLPLADMGIDTLELWQKNVNPEVLDPFLSKIIPGLDSFLRSKTLKGYTTTSVKKRRKTVQTLKSRKVQEELELELVKLQRKIICFIGRQSLKNCQEFIFSDTAVSSLINGQSSYIKLSLPYEDMQVDVYLDKFLPRVIELALYSSDRKTRIVCCEFLHAAFMVFLGREKYKENDMLKALAIPLLQLSCDLDQVVRQIFEPLFVQLIHWYTSPHQSELSNIGVIIEAIMEGITHPTNSNLKTFCGTCIGEYVKWSFKFERLNPEKNIKMIIKQMRYFSTHPDSAKKLGAALIFNSIYTILREEEHFVNLFWFEILHIFVLSLDSITCLNETFTVTQIKQALTHLQRVIVEKPLLFKEPYGKRRIPNGFNEGSLKDLCLWLLEQSASTSKHCRQACMKLFINIVPLSDDNTHNFVAKNLKDAWSIYDSKLITFDSLKKKSYVDSVSLLNYLSNLLCCLDGYKFLILHTNSVKKCNDVAVIKETKYFMENIQLADINTCLNLIQRKTWTYTIGDKDLFTTLKSECVLSILGLFDAIFSNKSIDKNDLLINCFFKMVANVLFSPQDSGLNETIRSDYKDILEHLFNNAEVKTNKNSIQNAILAAVTANERPRIHIEKHVSLSQRNFLKGVVLLSSTSLGLVINSTLISCVSEVLKDFRREFDMLANDNIVFISQIPDTTFSYLFSLFQFGFSNNFEESFKLVLVSDYWVQTIDMSEKKNAGLFFTTTFADAIIPHIIDCLNFKKFLKVILNANQKVAVTIINFILEYILKEEYKYCHRALALELKANYGYFGEYFRKNKEAADLGIEFFKLFFQIHNDEFLDVQDWLVNSLKTLDYDETYLELFGILAALPLCFDESRSIDLQTALSCIVPKIEAKNIKDLHSNIFIKLIMHLPAVKSVEMFEYLVKIYIEKTPSVDILSLLTKLIVRSDNNFQSKILQKSYEMASIQFTSDLLPAVFQNCNINVFEQFFVQNINTMLGHFEKQDLEWCIKDFILVEILFLRLPIGTEELKNCPIVTASGKPKLLLDLLKHARNAFRLLEGNQNDLRKYKCHAYNAMASIISNSLRKIALYEKLFQSEIHTQLHGIVNTEINYVFPREFDTLPTKKKILTNIRNELRENRQKSGNVSHSLHYIESQRIFNSSLSEDITKFDFTNSVLRSEHVAARKMMENLNVQSEVYLDMTEINKHECMGTICGTIQHIFDSGLCELPTEGEENVHLPDWMKGIRELLLNDNTHKNVKIFVVKVIDNTINIFSRYAKFFLEPLIKFVVDKVAGDNINYFVADVLVILSKWSSEIPDLSETESRLASNLVEHFIKNIEKDRQAIFKYNIELLKLLVESWKKYLTPPVETIFEMLSAEATSEIAIYVCSVFLVNNLKVWRREKEHEFLNLILAKLDVRTRNVYRACSETLGLLLNLLEADEFIKSANLKLGGISDLEKFVNCLEGIALKCPRFIDMYHVARLISIFNQVPTAQQIIHLKIINRRLDLSVDLLDEINEFRIVDWNHLIEDSNLEIQILSLEIIKKCLLKFSSYSVFPEIIRALSRNINHPNAIFRASLYNVAIEICNLSIDTDNTCKGILIHGLEDPDLDNKNRITEFLSKNCNIPEEVGKRFPYLLLEFYKPKVEDKFLGYSTYFLLSILSESEKYDLKIFKDPLEHCNFEDYKLNTNWKLQHPSVVPIFAETLGSIASFSSSTDADQDVFLLRRTQANPSFAPTQLSYQEQRLSKYVSLESTLGVDMYSTFKDPNTVPLSQKYKLNRRRFLKDKAKIARNSAHYEVGKKVKDVQERIESAKEREKNVTIYRSYRKGDFPDIQITLSAILKPLQVLAMHDEEIARILFVELFKGVNSSIKNREIFLSSIRDAIKTIFEASELFNRQLLIALFDILLTSKKNVNIDVKLVARVATDSDLASVGALLIEEYIESGVIDDGPGSSKRLFGQQDSETVCYIKLAELYKELEDNEAIRSILIAKTERKDLASRALKLEAQGRYRDSQDCFKELYSEDVFENVWKENYLNCFAQLSEWERIPGAVEEIVGKNPWEKLWVDEWCKRKILPWYITSNVKTQLVEQELNEDFLKQLNETLKHNKHCDYLVSNFSEQLSILWLCQNDISTAEQYLKISLKNILKDWQNLNPLLQSQRYQKLLQLHILIEIADFIQIYNTMTDDIDSSLNALTCRWRKRTEESTPSAAFSETKTLYRRQFVNVVLNKLKNLGADLQAQIKEMSVAKVRLDVELINTAADVEDYYLCRKHLKKYKELNNEKLINAQGMVRFLKAKTEKPDSQMYFLIESLTFFKKKSKDKAIQLKLAEKCFDVLLKISKLISDNKKLIEPFVDQFAIATTFEITLETSDLEQKAFEILKNCTEIYNVEEMVTDENTGAVKKFDNLSNAFIKLAYFIREKQDESKQQYFIFFILKAIQLDSSEARQLFPCLLMLDDLGTTYKDVFIQETDKIPTWMFLGWIPQLLANVDSPKVYAISKIILRIAQTFPEAIMYPYRLSRENYNITDESIASEARELIARLDVLLLNDDKINKFLKSLSYLSLPAAILKYYVSKITKCTDMDAVRKYVEEIRTEIFNQNRGSYNVSNLQGNMYKKIESFAKRFNSLLSKGMTLAKVKTFCKECIDDLNSMLNWKEFKLPEPSYLLKDYSPWLANFSAAKLEMELEIPGQYDGHKLPLPQHHVKISGFRPEIKIMPSLRKPFKIILLGNNGREYPFLLKFGEDVRQDQRIEQLFGLINGFLRNDSSCSKLGLDILTYQVVPLSSNLGLIQWIDDTIPMTDFIKTSFKNDKEVKLFKEGLILQYVRNLKRPDQNQFNIYGTSAVKLSKQKVVNDYMTLVKQVPYEILGTSFRSISTDAENYVALRNNFTKSYANICAAHWILGIGDRHLGNSLICLKNGKVLAIDFGHAFGTGTQIQVVPELVPFRLTPHITHLMQPLKEKGPFREYMIHCLKCLRANSPSLLATMNVFIQEPSLDWLEHASMTGDSQETDGTQWYPNVKIAQAKRKLTGANSVNIMCEELKDGCRNERYTDAYIKHVQGEIGDCFRAEFSGREDLSVEEQVDCLLDHATDYNLLGRMWQGWNPWI